MSGPSKTLQEPDLQGDELFTRNGFIIRGNPHAVMGFPEACSEISSRKERIQVLASSEEDCKAKAITRTPPVKRWRFGNLHIPIITCLNLFQEDEMESGVGKTNENPEEMPFWSFEKKTGTTEETEDDQNSYREVTEKFEFNSVLFGGGVKESICDHVCENEKQEYSKSPKCQSYLQEMSTKRESQTVSLIVADSCHGSTTDKILTNGSHLPVHQTLVSLSTSDLNQYTEDKENGSVVETEQAQVEDVCFNAGKWNNTYTVQ